MVDGGGPATAAPAAGPGITSRIWAWSVAHPWAVIVLVVAVQHGLTIGAKDLWFSDELRHGGVLADLRTHGDWLALRLNGALYPDKPPVYFWLLAGVQALAGSSAPWTIYAGLALTALVLLAATHRLAAALSGDRAVALAAVLVLASGSYLAVGGLYARMDLLFAAAIAMAWAGFFRGTSPGFDRRAVLAGFAFTALAAMIKGPLGVLLPVAALAGFLVWQGQARLLVDRAVLGGLALVGAVVAIWALGIVALEGTGYFARLFQGQIVDRALSRGAGGWGWLRYAVTLPLVFLPWSLLPLVAGRRGAGAGGDPGRAFAWIAVASGALILSLVSEKHEYYLIPLLVPLSVLAAGSYLRLAPRRRRIFWTLVAVFLAGLAALLLATGPVLRRYVDNAADYLPAADALVWPVAVLALGAVAIAMAGRRAAPAGLLVLASVQSALAAVTALAVFPALNPVLSPRALAAQMRPLIEAGHAPAAYGMGDGIFAYHLGMHYADAVTPEELRAFLDAEPRAVVVTRADLWAGLSGTEPRLAPVGCGRLAGVAMVILAAPPPARPVACGE